LLNLFTVGLASDCKLVYNTFAMPKAPAKDHEEKNDLHEVKTLLTWKALGRPYKKRKREFYLMIVFITICFCVIFYLFKEWMLMLTTISVAFLSIVLYSIPPHEVEHKITTQGVITGDHAYLYKELYDFWFDEKDGNKVLYIRTYAFIPGVLSLLLGDTDEKTVQNTLVKHIPYRELVEKTFMDKASNWLAKNFPLES